MIQEEYLALLKESLLKLDDAGKWLRRSYLKCEHINVKADLADDEFDIFETLTSRFARVSDMVLQKLFRIIDRLEFEEGGTLIDVLNRAEKRNLIESLDSFREIRELRNEIAHEYALDELSSLFFSVFQYTPVLFTIIKNIKDYCRKYVDVDGNKDVEE